MGQLADKLAEGEGVVGAWTSAAVEPPASRHKRNHTMHPHRARMCTWHAGPPPQKNKKQTHTCGTNLPSGCGDSEGKRKPRRAANARPSGQLVGEGLPSTAQILCNSSGCGRRGRWEKVGGYGRSL